MPYSLNGIGTHYWGKAHLEERRDVCEHCGSVARLRSYDTTNYFVVLFVPIVPLSKLRILDDCSRCRRHRAVKLKEWRRIRQESVSGAVADWERNAEDRDLAKKAIETCAAFDDPTTFVPLAGKVLSRFSTDAELMTLVGSVLGHFGHRAQAEQVLAKAAELDASPNASRTLERLRASAVRPRRERADWTGRFAAVLAPAILVLVLTSLAVATFKASSRHEVFLVNGLPRVYSVEVAGETYYLPPGQATAIEVAQRQDHVVAVTAGGPSIEPVELRVDVPFGEWFGGGRTVVVNPDRAALLLWSQAEYAVNPDPDKEMPSEVHVGEQVYTWKGLDYVFRSFPDEIELSSSRSRVVKDGLELVPGLSPVQVFSVIHDQVGAEAAVAYLQRVLEQTPDDQMAIFLLAGTAPEVFATFSEPHRAARPVEVEWHRAYQQFHQGKDDVAALEAEYDALLAAEPENSHLLYLAARLDLDKERMTARLRRAVELDPGNAYAFNALAYHKVAAGEFDEALPLASEARRLDPENPSFKAVELDAHLGLGRYDDPLRWNLEAQKEQPLSGELVAQEILLRSALGEVEAAAGCVETYLERLAAEAAGEQAEADFWRAYLDATVSYARDGLAAFGDKMAAINPFHSALALGDLDKASAALTEAEDEAGVDAYTHLLVYLEAVRRKDDQVAGRHFERAVELLADGDRVERLVAAGLGGSPPPGFDFRDLDIDPHQKAIALAALAEVDRRHRRDYRSLARKLNFRLGFQRGLLDGILSGA